MKDLGTIPLIQQTREASHEDLHQVDNVIFLPPFLPSMKWKYFHPVKSYEGYRRKTDWSAVIIILITYQYTDWRMPRSNAQGNACWRYLSFKQRMYLSDLVEEINHPIFCIYKSYRQLKPTLKAEEPPWVSGFNSHYDQHGGAELGKAISWLLTSWQQSRAKSKEWVSASLQILEWSHVLEC